MRLMHCRLIQHTGLCQGDVYHPYLLVKALASPLPIPDLGNAPTVSVQLVEVRHGRKGVRLFAIPA